MLRRHLLTLIAAAPLLRAEEPKIQVRIQRTRKDKASAAEMSPSLEIVLISDAPFPVRALDPQLEIGQVTLHNFRFAGERNEILIFSTLGNEGLRAGAAMALQYGNDRASRNELGNFRPPE